MEVARWLQAAPVLLEHPVPETCRIRGPDHQGAPRFEDAGAFPQAAERVGKVLDDMTDGDGVEAPTGKVLLLQ